MYHAARTCAVKQALTPGKSGWGLPAEDTEAWVDQMTWCIRHPEAVRRDVRVRPPRRGAVLMGELPEAGGVVFGGGCVREDRDGSAKGQQA